MHSVTVWTQRSRWPVCPSSASASGSSEAGKSEDLQAVIGRADAALFDAKQQGRNQVVVHDTDGAIVPSAADVREVNGLENRRTFQSRTVISAGDRRLGVSREAAAHQRDLTPFSILI